MVQIYRLNHRRGVIRSGILIKAINIQVTAHPGSFPSIITSGIEIDGGGPVVVSHLRRH